MPCGSGLQPGSWEVSAAQWATHVCIRAHHVRSKAASVGLGQSVNLAQHVHLDKQRVTLAMETLAILCKIRTHTQSTGPLHTPLEQWSL